MQIRRTFNLNLIIITLCFLFSSCAYGQDNGNIKKTATNKKAENTATSDINNILKKQILLTNEAKFTNNRTLEGASGFLINYNNATFAVTARHLLGEAGGVAPEIKINELNKALTNWAMMPRVVSNADNETIKLSAEGLDFSQSFTDIVLLKVLSKNFAIETLIPNFELPSVGEKLFLIGCPYSEPECKQNSYSVTFAEFDTRENIIVGVIDSDVDLSGFSGAPLINSKGEVLGALVGGGSVGGKNYVSATHIKEIRKIKF